jgi:hypothetical protein
MYAQVEQTSAAAEAPIPAPGLVRAIGIVEREIDGHDVAEIAFAHASPQLRHAADVAITEVDAEQPVGAARGIDDPLDIAERSRQRFLAEHRQAMFQANQRLLCMQTVRRGEHDSVETPGCRREQRVEVI